MSSRAKKLERQVIETKNYNRYCAENSLLGSIIISCGKLAKISENKCVDEYINKTTNISRYKNKWKCARDIVDYYVKQWKISDENKKYLHLVVDNKNIYTPLVTLVINDMIMPISEDATYNGALLAMQGVKEEESHRYELEPIYE